MKPLIFLGLRVNGIMIFNWALKIFKSLKTISKFLNNTDSSGHGRFKAHMSSAISDSLFKVKKCVWLHELFSEVKLMH